MFPHLAIGELHIACGRRNTKPYAAMLGICGKRLQCGCELIIVSAAGARMIHWAVWMENAEAGFFQCEACGERFHWKNEMAGRRVRCTKLLCL
jgi:hypothetical protein